MVYATIIKEPQLSNERFFLFEFDVCFVLVEDEESVLKGTTDITVGELISFASFDIPNETNPQNQTTDVSD